MFVVVEENPWDQYADRSDAVGPFDTQEEAIDWRNAQDTNSRWYWGPVVEIMTPAEQKERDARYG